MTECNKNWFNCIKIDSMSWAGKWIAIQYDRFEANGVSHFRSMWTTRWHVNSMLVTGDSGQWSRDHSQIGKFVPIVAFPWTTTGMGALAMQNSLQIHQTKRTKIDLVRSKCCSVCRAPFQIGPNWIKQCKLNRELQGATWMFDLIVGNGRVSSNGGGLNRTYCASP